MVDNQLDVTKLLTAMLPKNGKYVKYIQGLEIQVGKFRWVGDVLAAPEPPAEQAQQPEQQI